MQRAFGLGLALALIGVLGACGDQGQRADAPAADRATPATDAAPGVSATDPAVAGELPPGVTMQMVNEGQQLFGTVCVACHGPGGTGSPLGPALNDDQWLDIDGSYESMVTVISNGVQQPREYPAPMPPRGGGNFNDEQVRSLAAYVYSLSHRGS
ncbi:hypothetical protein BH24GEM3_BH24GEM3_09570 [soil metagenome]|jgi:mono/diheme cytochrome c family protein|nr:cytochrome c [Gemmatimonadota bacterium]